MCGPFHNTCFDTHRMAVWSNPIVIMGRIPFRLSDRVELSPALGIRYVPRPAVHDLTAAVAVPAGYFRFDAGERTDTEAGARITLRLCGRTSVFGEERWLSGRGSPWDPKWRTNWGVRWKF